MLRCHDSSLIPEPDFRLEVAVDAASASAGRSKKEPGSSDWLLYPQELVPLSAPADQRGHECCDSRARRPPSNSQRSFFSVSCTDLDQEAPSSLRDSAKHSYDVDEELFCAMTPRSFRGSAGVKNILESPSTRLATSQTSQEGAEDAQKRRRACYAQGADMIDEAVVLDVKGGEAYKPKSGFWTSFGGLWIQRESSSCHSIESKFERTAPPNKTSAAAPSSCKKAPSVVEGEVRSRENLDVARTNATASRCWSERSLEHVPNVVTPVAEGEGTGLGPDATMEFLTAALHSAASIGHSAAVEMLLAASANPSCIAADGATPLHRAARHGHYHTVRILLDSDQRVLMQCDHSGFSPLHDAAHAGHQPIVHLLLERRGRWASWASAAGTTPLDLAANGGHCEAVRELLTAGMWPVQNPAETLRPLQLAAVAGHKQVVKLLLMRLKHFLT